MIKASCVLNRSFIRLEGVDYSLLLVELGKEFVHRVRISCSSRDIVTEFHLLSWSVNYMLRVNIGSITFGRPWFASFEVVRAEMLFFDGLVLLVSFCALG